MDGLNKLYGESKNYVSFDDVLDLVKQLDEPQKVKIPKFVADWIEYCKNIFLSLARALAVSEEDFYNYGNKKDYLDLLYFLGSMVNQEKFALAWVDGYEIEKEKRYLVKIKGNVSEKFLIFGLVTKEYFFSKDNSTSKRRQATHTRKELEDAGFGEIFNSPLFEVKEVQNEA